MTPTPLDPAERARRVIARELALLGEHVLDRETAATRIRDALTADGTIDAPRYVPASCGCFGTKPRPAILDRHTRRHALLTSTDAATRWAARWSLPGETPGRLFAWHTVKENPRD